MPKLTNENNFRGDRIMPILDTSGWEWGEDIQPELIPAGTRCLVRIVRTHMGVDVQRRPYLMLAYESLEHPNADEFVDNFNILGGTNMSPRERNRETRKWKAMQRCFDIYLPSNGQVDLKDWEGKEGLVEVDVGTHKTRGAINRVSEYLPKEDGN